MLSDTESGKVASVIVKDLSRFGRDYIDMGYYLERHFPAHGVCFLAINDNADSQQGPYDMLLPLKNVFNAQYTKDISQKVHSAFAVKQNRGEFVGVFASYGYLKDPDNHSYLIIDPVAGRVVQRIFEMAASGMGQIKIAHVLNEESLVRQLEQLPNPPKPASLAKPWIDKLVQLGKLEELDRETIVQIIKEIKILEDRRIEILYLFSDTLRNVLESNTVE